MRLNFFKYQGTGNDFIMVDNRKEDTFDIKDTKLIKQLCDRRFGIGGDGFILLEDHLDPAYDFQMIYFNSDGNPSSMCGNGGRCIVQFAHDMGVIKKETTFLAVDGEHDAFIKDGKVHLKMIDVIDVESNESHYYMNTGSPHYVKFVEKIKDYPVFEEGKKIRNSDRFKKAGTNVNFIEKSGSKLWVRTYERGVENETYSCGTGVTAAAIAASFKGMASPVNIITLGGELSVSFEKNDHRFKNIYLIGPAKQVYSGVIEI
jgi:diaminopimelate epimerase